MSTRCTLTRHDVIKIRCCIREQLLIEFIHKLSIKLSLNILYVVGDATFSVISYCNAQDASHNFELINKMRGYANSLTCFSKESSGDSLGINLLITCYWPLLLVYHFRPGYYLDSRNKTCIPMDLSQ